MSNEISVSKPTRLLVEKNDKGDMTKGRIEEATLAYLKLKEGELAFGSETERDYSVNVIVTEETAKNFKSVFQKNGYKQVPNEQFTKSFRIDPPYPEQRDQYIIKLKANTAYSNDIPDMNVKAGDLVPYEAPSRPKLYEIIDGKAVDVTMTSRAANGSKGVVAFKVTNNKFGTFPTLSGVAITELVEYAPKASLESSFGISEGAETSRKSLPAPTASDDSDEGETPAPSINTSTDDWF